MHCAQDEFSEMMGRLPWKTWKKYSHDELLTWTSVEQRAETIFEGVDLIHFIMNIFIIFGISADEVFAYYKEKNKENFARQDRGY
jgi:hypothetical protein